MSVPAPPFRHPAPRADWLSLQDEEVIDPGQRIVDCHHHLWDHPGNHYLTGEFVADLDSGHRIDGTVFVQCHFAHLETGPAHLRPVGETRAVMDMVRAAAAQGREICQGIVGFADLSVPDTVEQVLDAHARESEGRLVGIRQPATRDPAFPHGVVSPPQRTGLFSSTDFRQGFACLGRRDLVFDVWAYSSQLGDVADLAGAFPDTRFVVDHCGGLLGIGPYAGRRREEFALWRDRVAALAQRPNVAIKIGGLGMITSGFGFDEKERPPHSSQLADAWRPIVETCIDLFGTQRCMFESNFPVDKGSTGYRVLWNAFKRLASNASPAERDALFFGTARRIYRLDDLDR